MLITYAEVPWVRMTTLSPTVPATYGRQTYDLRSYSENLGTVGPLGHPTYHLRSRRPMGARLMTVGLLTIGEKLGDLRSPRHRVIGTVGPLCFILQSG